MHLGKLVSASQMFSKATKSVQVEPQNLLTLYFVVPNLLLAYTQGTENELIS